MPEEFREIESNLSMTDRDRSGALFEGANETYNHLLVIPPLNR